MRYYCPVYKLDRLYQAGQVIQDNHTRVDNSAVITQHVANFVYFSLSTVNIIVEVTSGLSSVRPIGIHICMYFSIRSSVRCVWTSPAPLSSPLTTGGSTSGDVSIIAVPTTNQPTAIRARSDRAIKRVTITRAKNDKIQTAAKRLEPNKCESAARASSVSQQSERLLRIGNCQQ